MSSHFCWLLTKKMKFISNVFVFKESFLEVGFFFFHLQELGRQKARQEEMSGRKGHPKIRKRKGTKLNTHHLLKQHDVRGSAVILIIT